MSHRKKEVIRFFGDQIFWLISLRWEVTHCKKNRISWGGGYIYNILILIINIIWYLYKYISPTVPGIPKHYNPENSQPGGDTVDTAQQHLPTYKNGSKKLHLNAVFVVNPIEPIHPPKNDPNHLLQGTDGTNLFIALNAYSPIVRVHEYTLPETNSEFTPENWWLGDEFPFGMAHLQVLC